MLAKILVVLIRTILSLRYKIVLKNPAPRYEEGGVLILANHQALIDPVLLMSVLHPKYAPRPLADENQLSFPIIKTLINSFRPIPIPDVDKNSEKKDQVFVALEEVIRTLKRKENALIYPAGRIYRTNREDLRASSSVDFLLKNAPETKVLLVRINGLWGSDFSWARGTPPSLFQNLGKRLLGLLANGIFFGPRRTVTIDFSELPSDFPCGADKLTINRALENFYNTQEVRHTYSPHFWWEGYKSRILPEVEKQNSAIDLSHLPAPIIGSIKAKLAEVSGVKNPQLTDRLSQELGMDSIAIAEVMSWVGDEYNHRLDNLESVLTVADVILVACGQSLKKETVKKPVPEAWLKSLPKNGMHIPPGKTIPEVFLNHAYNDPSRVIVADEIGGLKTYRHLLIGVSLLSKIIAKQDGKRIGIMLPSSVTATVIYTSTLFAGKIPVMVNWTVGTGVLKACLDNVEVHTILTSKKLIEKLKTTGFNVEELPYNWVFLEDAAKEITSLHKIKALLATYLPWRTLKAPQNSDPAAILFTSGSEARPKAVPLSHANLLQNLKDCLETAKTPSHEKILGILPPFHSFGLLTNIVIPLCTSIPVVYHANPTESAILADLIDRYKTTFLLGTPTFINGILRVADKKQLQSMRLIVTGAEKCPEYVYEKLQEYCPQAIIAEGYGITECSPVVSLNEPEHPVIGSLGKIFASLEFRIVHPETFKVVPQGENGILLVRGPSIFSGYLNHQGPSPFVKFEEKEWYNTGDLVRLSPEGVIFFAGRLKRFVKIAGEMISLVAIEEILTRHYPANDNGPLIAVEAANADAQPELVLFSTIPLERESVNNLIRQSGLSGLHNVRRVESIDLIPVLGTGKTDYKTLRARLQA